MNVETSPTLYCARHRGTETRLRCSRCETPICPQCMVMTPVGARCPKCADVRGAPRLGVGIYARAIAAALGIAIGGGLVLGIMRQLMPFGYFLVIIALAYFAGLAISRAVNGRSGRGLQIIAAASVVLAFLSQQLILFAIRAPAVLLEPGIVLGLLIRSAVFLIANPLELLVIALAAWLAATRL